MSNNTSAGLNIAQAAEASTSDFLISSPLSREPDVSSATDDISSSNDVDDNRERVHRRDNKANKFNYWSVVTAALIFITVIAWFEALRVWIEYLYVMTDSDGLFKDRARAHMAYALMATLIALVGMALIKQLEYI